MYSVSFPMSVYLYKAEEFHSPPTRLLALPSRRYSSLIAHTIGVLVPEDSGINYPLLGFLLLACPLQLLPSSYTFGSFSSAASTIDTSFRPHLLFTGYHLPIKCRPDLNHGWTEKEGRAKGRWPLPATLSPGMWRIIFIVGKYSSSTYTQQPDSSWTSKRNPPFTTHLSYSNFSKDK